MKRVEKQAEMIETSGRILVVDDHRQARESMADVLRHVGHSVSCCSSAAEALQVVEKESFDCVVTDLQDARHVGDRVPSFNWNAASMAPKWSW